MALSLRAATPDDAPRVLELVRALAEFEKLGPEVVATVDDVRVALTGPRPLLEAVLAERDGEPEGFAAYYFTCSTFAARPLLYLEDLFVLPSVRQRGTGRALLAHLARIAEARGCVAMQWEVLDWNLPAVRFYESLGARPRAGWTVYRLPKERVATLARSG